ncbi:MAG: ATP-binding protein, partial [Candidatus Latescibacterota bacterium]
WHVASDIPNHIKGDSDRFTQIVTNLVGNAIKFTPSGQITINVKTQHQSSDEITLQMDVIDTGIGIPQEKQMAIFEAFSQADASTTRQYGGTGLGLTISARLVELMGGKIWVTSDVGHGSQFSFTATFKKANATSDTDTQKQLTLAHTDLHILTVEDNPTNQLFTQQILEKLGCRVIVAKNGQEAVSHCKKNTFDLILMDGQMPVMDGFEATQIIRKHEAIHNKHTPIIALTAHALSDDRKRFLDAGMDDYLSKPFTPGQLIDTINRILKT